MGSDGAPTDGIGIAQSLDLRIAFVTLLLTFLIYTYIQKRKEDEACC